MEVIGCKGCKRLFNYMSGPKLCPECLKALEEKFQEVKEYLNKHPNSSMDQVSKETECSVKQIKEWVREERLILSSALDSGITCDQCGTPICSGRFCDKCKSDITNNLMSAINKPKAPEPKKDLSDHKNKMRFLQT